MGIVATVAFLQSAALEDRLAWIAWAETATAVGTVVLALLGIGLAVAGFYMLRAATRVLRMLERSVERLAPRTEPLLERATRVADEAAEISRRVRMNVDHVHETIEDLNRQLRTALEAAEQRVRHFGTVVDAVQGEVEELLLDAASTARGLHAAAEALRGNRNARSGLRNAGSDG